MKALTTILAASLVFANGAFAADNQQVGASAAGVTVASAPLVAAAAAAPAAVAAKPAANAQRTRAEVQAEAIEAVKNYKTPLAVQLELYK